MLGPYFFLLRVFMGLPFIIGDSNAAREAGDAV
jgi:hypothetical protein